MTNIGELFSFFCIQKPFGPNAFKDVMLNLLVFVFLFIRIQRDRNYKDYTTTSLFVWTMSIKAKSFEETCLGDRIFSLSSRSLSPVLDKISPAGEDTNWIKILHRSFECFLFFSKLCALIRKNFGLSLFSLKWFVGNF